VVGSKVPWSEIGVSIASPWLIDGVASAVVLGCLVAFGLPRRAGGVAMAASRLLALGLTSEYHYYITPECALNLPTRH
jgi:hypothetical protein